MKNKELDERIEEFKVKFLKTQKEREKVIKLQHEKMELEWAKRFIRDYDRVDFSRSEDPTLRYERYYRAVEIVKGDILKNMKTASVEDYTDWLRGYLANGETPSDYCDYPMPTTFGWFVATRDFDLIHLCGSFTMNIIVPVGVNFLGDVNNIGHSALYFMKDYSHAGDASYIPVFSDVRFKKRTVKIETIKEIFRRWFHAL